MTKVKFIVMFALIIMLSAFTINNSISWKIDDGYTIAFTSKDPTGIFTKMSGEIEFDEDNLSASKFDVVVDVSSINTGNGMQNKHAVSAKWFDADKFPTINFKSKSFTKSKDGYSVFGTLDMHGVQKDFSMPFTFEDNVFTSSFTVNRLDFNIGTTTGSGKKVPADLKIDISVPVSK